MSVPGGDIGRMSIIGEMQEAEERERLRRLAGGIPDESGPDAVAEPAERPDARAQWDEVHGRWIEWDLTTETWVDAPDPHADGPEHQGG